MAKKLLSTLKDLQERTLPGGMTHYDEDGDLLLEGSRVSNIGALELPEYTDSEAPPDSYYWNSGLGTTKYKDENGTAVVPGGVTQTLDPTETADTEEASAGGNYALAVGPRNATANSDHAVAIGDGPTAGYEGVGIGLNSSADQSSVAIGARATNKDWNSTAIGRDAASGDSDVAVGWGAEGNGGAAIALGTQAFASGYRSLAGGFSAGSQGDYSLSVGPEDSNGNPTLARSHSDIAIGPGATTAKDGGASTRGSSNGKGIAIGHGAHSDWDDSVAIGNNATAGQSDYGQVGVAVGAGASATVPGNTSPGMTAIGTGANGTGSRATVVGDGTSAAGEGTALGFQASAASNSLAVGYQASTAGTSVALGFNSQTTAIRGTAVGYQSSTSAQYATAIGEQASASASGALGLNASIGVADAGRIGVNQLAFGATAGTLANADLNNGEMTVEYDEANGWFNFRYKDSAGTMQTATL